MRVDNKVVFATFVGAALVAAGITYYRISRSPAKSKTTELSITFEQGFLTLDSVLIVLQSIKQTLPVRLREIKLEFLSERLKLFEKEPESYHQTILKYLRLQEEEIEKVCNSVFEKFKISHYQFDMGVNKYKASILVNQDKKHLRPDTVTVFSRSPAPENLTEEVLAKVLNLYTAYLQEKLTSLKGDFLSPMEKAAAQIESLDKVYKETGFDEIQIATAISRYSESDQIKRLYENVLKAEEALTPPMEVYSF
jgi:hypothetical protein